MIINGGGLRRKAFLADRAAIIWPIDLIDPINLRSDFCSALIELSTSDEGISRAMIDMIIPWQFQGNSTVIHTHEQ